MKKNYQEPAMDVQIFDVEDVITASVGGEYETPEQEV